MNAKMMKPRGSQRGAVALVVALVLVFGMALVAFFSNRGMIFEQKTSANQYRYTRAFEMAEAGLEWATARLNDDIFLLNAPSCVAETPASQGTEKKSFRERYLGVPNTVPPAFSISSVPRPGCSVAADGTPTCSCPTAGNSPTLGSAADPRFSVEFRPVAGDALAVEIISYGCTNAGANGAPCDPNATPVSDATAVVRAVFKVRPKFPNAPGAGLVAGSAAVSGGNLNVINLDVASNGITINSGTTVDLGTGTSVTTLPGTPPRASVLDNDPSLNALTNADANGDLFFQSFMGETQAQYKANPLTWLITSGSCGSNVRCTSCTNPGNCGSAVSAAIDTGVTQFWAESAVSFVNGNLPAVGTIGTALKPITFATSASVELRSNLVAYGMFYVGTGTALENWDYDGSGSAKIYGSFVSRGNFDKGSGTLDLIYDAKIFGKGETTGLLIRVPGSWRDKSCEYSEVC